MHEHDSIQQRRNCDFIEKKKKDPKITLINERCDEVSI